jgi:hypothetical protein
MKSMALPGLFAAFVILAGSVAQAQYKSPRQYFPKDAPGANPSGRTAPATPGTPGAPATPTTPARPAVPDRPKFKDVVVNSQFYFLTDTNRAYPWTKISETSAKNAKGVTRAFNVETPIQR